LLGFFRAHRILPREYLDGIQGVGTLNALLGCFADGRYFPHGWSWFFPYSIAVKTPIPTMIVLALAAGAGVASLRKHPAARATARAQDDSPPSSPATNSSASSPTTAIYATRILYTTAPLWILIALFELFAQRAQLNLGIRYILPIFPPIFILAGAAARWLRPGNRLAGAMLAASVAWLIAESLAIRPHYLAYFNELAGGSTNGYQCLVDSSLDWGQDLPALSNWLKENNLNSTSQTAFGPATPVYLSYFGSASPAYYGIDATLLPCSRECPADLAGVYQPLSPGVYCISASMLQLYHRPPGPWTATLEATYRQLLRELAEKPGASPRINGPGVRSTLRQLQFARLCAFLRRRKPDAMVGYSILIYRLSADDIASATGVPIP
jgi:hypothetical protein